MAKNVWDSFGGTTAAANLFSKTSTSNSKQTDKDAGKVKVPKIYELDSVKKTIVLDELAIRAN